jgi:hypothetical protein
MGQVEPSCVDASACGVRSCLCFNRASDCAVYLITDDFCKVGIASECAGLFNRLAADMLVCVCQQMPSFVTLDPVYYFRVLSAA